jgi:mannose-binding lectin 2
MGIFFDTYSNVQQGHQQFISVMLGDGKTAYDHDRDGGEAKVAGPKSPLWAVSECTPACVS